MVFKKIVTRRLLAIIMIFIICLYMPIFVYASEYDYYPNKIPNYTMTTNKQYNDGDGKTNTFTLIAKKPFNLNQTLSADKMYNVFIFYRFNRNINVGGSKIEINQQRFFIEIPGKDRQYFNDNGWMQVFVEKAHIYEMYFGVEVDCSVTSTLNLPGYTYITYDIMDFQFGVYPSVSTTDNLLQESNETSKNIFDKISDFFNGFFDNLGNTVLGWIVPSSEQLTEFLNEVNAWFSERLGFIWYPFSLAIDMVTAFAGGESSSTFNIPALELSLMGNKYKIWDSMNIDMDAFDIFKYVRYFTSVILVAGVVKLAYDKWDEWIGGHGVG